VISSLITPPITLAFLLAALVAGLAWKLRALDLSGVLAATLLGGSIYAFGGLSWAILLISFFVSSSLLSLAFKARKKKMAADFAKGGRRDWVQVFANGGLALLALALYQFGMLPLSLAWLAFAAALATVTADTWATELGVLSAQSPRLISTWKVVPPGTSGGISLLGTSATLLGSGFIAVPAFLFASQPYPFAFYLLITLAGLLGSLSDSWMGATVQAIYYCPLDDKETERHPLHNCGTQTEHIRGWPWLTNDWVNFIASLVAVLFALLVATQLSL
jgi:uncharacterized protein (TIGR00297 family)